MAAAGEQCAPAPHAAGEVAARFARRDSTFDSGRALLLGALGCYALILFNLIYGVASVSETRVAETDPAQRFTTNDLQRQIGLPTDARSPLGTPVWAGLCKPDRLFDDVRPATLRRTGNSTRPGHR